jgi:hypothetical protein
MPGIRCRRGLCIAACLLLPLLSRPLRAQDSIIGALPRVVVPPPVPPPWRFQIDVGFQDVTGNRDLTVANAAFIVERRPNDRLILNMKLEGRYGRSNGVEAVNYQLARVRFDWNPRNIVSPFVGLDMARDPVRKSALRIQGGTGFNINTDIRDAHRTYFSVGIVADHQVYTAGVTPATTDDKRWMLRAATQQLIGQGTRIEGVAKLQPALDEVRDYLAVFEASVRVSLTRRIGLTTKMEWNRDSRPPDGVRPDDRSLSAALSVSW